MHTVVVLLLPSVGLRYWANDSTGVCALCQTLYAIFWNRAQNCPLSENVFLLLGIESFKAIGILPLLDARYGAFPAKVGSPSTPFTFTLANERVMLMMFVAISPATSTAVSCVVPFGLSTVSVEEEAGSHISSTALRRCCFPQSGKAVDGIVHLLANGVTGRIMTAIWVIFKQQQQQQKWYVPSKNRLETNNGASNALLVVEKQPNSASA